MTYSFETLRDFIGALAVVAMLAASYGGIRRVLRSEAQARVCLGVLFGLCAAVQMSMPLSPYEGVIVDMRNVPVALAGAFLGVRGLLLCVGIAIAARLSIGGMGASAGVIAILIAGLVGFLWAEATRHVGRRGVLRIATLAGCVNLHLLAGLMLPTAPAIWFFTVAAPLVIVLNLISVTVVGLLLDRERVRLDEEAYAREAMRTDPASGLLLPQVLLRELRYMRSADRGGQVAGIAVVKVRHGAWVRGLWGQDGFGLALGALRKRLEGELTLGHLAASDTRTGILIPLTQEDLAKPDVAARLDASAGGLDVALGGRVTIKIGVSTVIKRMDVLPESLPGFLGYLNGREGKIASRQPKRRAVTKAIPVGCDAMGRIDAVERRLFAQADLMMDTR
ncbi:LytS/YhcK type 5TM receptor domain-containing protein [Pseudaestuariivita sp.]|uniref:LytS/YhcK type 5TM receptor domain-containing protein n=1 Tax=Pseudaestuariivita sp. TaxID=2211669 RepID=UPI0040594CBC